MRHTDTAIVNVPLDKRGGGSLDAQIDRFKREQAATARRDAKAAQRREDKATAKALLAEHLPAMVAKYGPKLGEKPVRDMLIDWSKWEPAKLIGFVGRFLDEQDRAARANDAPYANLPF
jgi:hypothetical protein